MEFEKIKNFETYGVSRDGRVKNLKRGTILKPEVTSGGYLRVCLYKSKTQKVNVRIHKIVYETFKGKIQHTINHKDRIKSHNHVDNLEDIPLRNNLIHGNNTDRKLPTGIILRPNGTYRARVRKDGKVYETDKSTEDKAVAWYKSKIKELKLSSKYSR